jgi:Restriction endonuclease EcoRV
MNASIFVEQLQSFEPEFRRVLATQAGDWVVKGFIDIYQNIYTISVDTKVISKIIELMLFPVIVQFSEQHNYQLVLSEHQNHYPDITFIAPDGSKIAVDFKSTYRTSKNSVSGFTLGAFTGYFRHRESSKNITFPYQDYAAHIVLGIVYSRTDAAIDERKHYALADLPNIVSVANDFAFIIQEKWRIANDKPGSGNTKNIGSSKNIEILLSGNGVFATYGKKIFDDYWIHYLTKDMAKLIDSTVPYTNLKTYLQWRDSLK